MTTRSFSFGRLIAVMAGLSSSLCPALSSYAQTSDTEIPAVRAFDAPGCSDVELGGITADFGLGSVTVPSPFRTNPEWKAIILDPTLPPHRQPPAILEGFVNPTPNDQKADSQSTAEVAEEDISWTHYTHDYTFKVLPDPGYRHLLASWARRPGVTIPEFGDDPFGICAGLGGTLDNGSCVLPPEDYVKFSTEIHPPLALVTYRQNHVALDFGHSSTNCRRKAARASMTPPQPS